MSEEDLEDALEDVIASAREEGIWLSDIIVVLKGLIKDLEAEADE